MASSMSPGSFRSDLPGKAPELQEEEGGAQSLGGTRPSSTPSPSTSACPLPQPLPREQEEATRKGKAGAPKSFRGGRPSTEVAAAGLTLTFLQPWLPQDHPGGRLCPPRPALSQSSLGTPPSLGLEAPFLWVGGPGLDFRDQAGLGWAFGGGLLGESVASFLNSGAAGRA